MARFLFDGGELVIDSSGNARPNLSFTVWTDRNGGTNVTAEMRAPDGVSEVAVETDADGEIPYLRGPDDNKGPLYRDTGTDTRSVWRSAEAEKATTETVDGFVDTGLPLGGTENVDILWRGPTERSGVWAPPPSGGSGGASDWDDITNKPATFPPAPHSHTSGQVSDATTVGRAVLTAADAQSARAAIGAGTGNGTSNLTLGTSGTTAAPGNHSHSATAVQFTPTGALTATNVQDAIVQAGATGGSGGTAQVLVWRYTAGGWPTLPALKPAGVLELRALGPTYPTSLPSWAGLAADKIPLSYSKVNVL